MEGRDCYMDGFIKLLNQDSAKGTGLSVLRFKIYMDSFNISERNPGFANSG